MWPTYEWPNSMVPIAAATWKKNSLMDKYSVEAEKL